VGAPLRPSRQDIDLLQRFVAEKHDLAACASPRVVLLGVTPEIATMRWPPETCLLAVDRHLGMIENIWPGNESVHAAGGMCRLDQNAAV